MREFLNNDDGNVALMFSLLAVPLLMAVGAAVDMSRVSAAHVRLQDATDTAALSAALKYNDEGAKQMRLEAQQLVTSNFATANDVSLSKIKARKTKNNTVEVTTTASVKPMFVQMFGYPNMDISASSEASLGNSIGMELAIAFDSTNSMAFDSRWDNAMSSIQGTLKDMKRLTGKKEFYVSLVPFTDRVNIGTANFSWLTSAPPAGWNGCVEPREYARGGYTWSVDDQNPFAEPFEASVPGVTGALSACPALEITGPTKKPKDIIDATKKMTHGGTGRLDTGLAWSWRLVSPKWQGRWGVTNYPASSGAKIKRKKKIIFVSDGNTTAYEHEMSKERDWDWNEGSKVGFEHIVDLCTRIKNDGVEIYMLKIDGNPHADSYFQQCASSSSHYYKITQADEIPTVFDDILNGLREELRLVR